jgi:hypothetical protein
MPSGASHVTTDHASGRIVAPDVPPRDAGSASLAAMTAPRALDDLLGRPMPDLTLPDPRGEDFRLRQFVPHRSLVLFFYVMNGTPG